MVSITEYNWQLNELRPNTERKQLIPHYELKSFGFFVAIHVVPSTGSDLVWWWCSQVVV